MDWLGTQCEGNSVILFSDACFQKWGRNVGRVGCNDFQRGLNKSWAVNVKKKCLNAEREVYLLPFREQLGPYILGH